MQVVSCAARGDGAGVTEAVEAGASVDWIDREGWAALHHAAASNKTEIVNLLLAYSADLNVRSMAHGEEGATPLHLAACIGNTAVMRLLLESGADAETLDRRGKTAVHWAALQGKLESLKVLQDYNCNLRAQVNGRGTALHYAAAFGDMEVVEWLAERGVDVTGKDKNGRLAKDVAKRNGHRHIHHFLKEETKRQPSLSRKKSSSNARKPDLADHTSAPLPIPLPRTIFEKNVTSWEEAPIREATRGSPANSNSAIASKKKGWIIRSMSVGNKAGLKLQMGEMKKEMRDMENTLRAKDVQIARLQGDIFTTELEKVQIENQLKEMRTVSGRGTGSPGQQRDPYTKEPSDNVCSSRETPPQERTALLLKLQDVKARLKKEERDRGDERYVSDLKIASLTSELEEATQKLKKYGVRQKKLLSKNKSFEVDLTTARVPSGLPDLGDTGAMNSTVQCLYGVAALRNYLTTDAYRRDVASRGEVTEALAGVFKALKAGVQPEILAKRQHLQQVVESLEEVPRDDHRHDAFKVLTLLLTWLHRDLCQADGTSVVSQLFFGSHEHNVTCRWTGADVSRVTEDFLVIYLDVTADKEISLQSLLAHHYQPVSNEYECPHCLRSHLCRKQISVTHLPPILIIHLARKDKRVNVTFPSSRFMVHEVIKCDSPSFELFGAVTLQTKGLANSRQHTAFCRNLPDSTWYFYENERVHDVNTRRVLDQPNTNILFFSAEVNK
ncbi:Ankyrin-2 [Chionoecetes opilio]|uniref:Ankyrin-2 n=1 Tax=Chionoecetes opilio TaxID=41210 RepID=A0A8J4XKM2_CHIOP|nr:Ankyrin-2 [Chionoecetes opilio]